MASGLVLFTYIGAHLLNHALGLISLGAAEAGMEYAVEVWYSLPGTILLYGAFATHFMMALIAEESEVENCTSPEISAGVAVPPPDSSSSISIPS